MRTSEREIFIDLGEPRDPDEEPADGPAPARAVRPWLLAACVGALLVLLGAAAPVPASPWRFPLTVPVGPGVSTRVVVAGDLMLTVAGSHAVTAWSLRDGGRRWVLDRDVTQIENAIAVGGLVVFSSYLSEPVTAGSSGVMTYAVDAGTGTVRWEAPGYAYSLTTATDRLLLFDGDSAAAVVDPRTGAVRWRYGSRSIQVAFEQPALVTRAGPGVEGTEALTIDEAGHLSSLALADGSVHPIGTLTPGATIMGFDGDTVSVEIGKNLDGDPNNRDEESSVVTYDRPTLRELWRVVNRTQQGGHPVRRCGRWMCSLDGGVGRALDPRTGEVVWTAAAYPYGVWQRAGGDLLIGAKPESGEMMLMNLADGRERMRFGLWAWSGDLGGDLLAMLPPLAGGRIWLGSVSGTGEPSVRPLFAFGPVGLRLEDCTLSGGWIVCVSGVQAIVVDLRAALRASAART
ncbi:outer membrane protein assembly factor BamB [Allocatelliglobosispora scoriae]|uniref:Outer membrane protein assembly factor BamB n=1 Tax=Allocatelliglobosispora scoriae TaxID=643052 RepID=A0A841BN11_9ACTN|nr:PQQ-binding-like beta-propeller repeat protein [Allocatelliglobosispora scoriae]MBB5868768.1 outer membrane protein assembly factor BamB [Allocatelliglobosispora scoriae]